MKDKIIELLSKFDTVTYDRLHRFLYYDKRVQAFSGQSQYVDYYFSMKSKGYPKYIFNELCEGDVFNISEDVLYQALTDENFVIEKKF